VKCRTDYEPTAQQSNAILTGLRKLGYIDVARDEYSINRFGFFSRPILSVSLTPAGERAGVWDKKNGFCIGQKRVVEVTRFSTPSDPGGVPMSQAEYKWAIKDSPGWVVPSEFPEVKGIAEPVKGTAFLREMSDGWQVVDI
jgi:hypothetical protein